MTDIATPDPESPEMIGDLPTSLIDSILTRWGHSDSEAPETDLLTDPEAGIKPVVPPSTEPENDPGVEPVTPDNLPPGTPGTDPETGEPVSPPTPPGGDLFPSEEPATTPPASPPPPSLITLSDGSQLTLSQVEELIRRGAPTPPSPTVPTSPSADTPPAPYPSLPPFTEEDLDNPAIRAVVMVAARQQQELTLLRERQEQLANETRATQYRENAEIVNSAVTAFKSQYNVPDDLMMKISEQASTLLDSEVSRMQQAGEFNPYAAVTNSLTNAYWLVPEARQFEFERQTSNRQAAVSRQRKLNGVGGSSGSAPRTAPGPDLSTPDGRRTAAIAEVAAAMGLNQEGAN